ncbi:MAG: hypothetical protein KDH09_17590 [Chrysiogenetes bacterium]|nr:hypothetical protein [Chrysiogenetes bacterium]
MRLFHRTVAAAAFLCIFSLFTLAQAVPAQAREDFQAYWDNGVRFKSENLSVSFGGRAQFDTMWGWGNRDFEVNVNGGPFIDGTEFRRLRLFNAGEINKKVAWKVEIDFAGGKAAISSAYMRFRDVAAGTDITIGNQKEPLQLDEMTSANYITFMERSLMSTFYPGYSVGALLTNNKLLDDKLSLAAGIFRPGEGRGAASGPGATEDGDYAITLRATLAPILEDKGEQVVHLGVGYRFHEDPACGGSGSVADPANTIVFPTTPSGAITARECRYRARAGTHATGTYALNTLDFDADSIQQLGFELAAQMGIVSVQGEYMLVFVSNDRQFNAALNNTGEPRFHAWYVQASVFATGEFRPYSGGKFGRVKPGNGLGKDGFGAIEVAFRVDSVNLTDRAEGVAGGNETNYTLGVNWYLTPNARIMTNYVLATFDELALAPGLKEGHLQVVQSRFQVDF